MPAVASAVLLSFLACADAARTAVEAASNSSDAEACDPVDDLVEFSVSQGFFGRGAKKKEADKWCEATYDVRGRVRTLTLFEARWLQEKCKEGASIGQKLCGQTADSGPTAVPEEIIDHFESGGYGEAAKGWQKLADGWCGQVPRVKWTGFKDCYHACQYLHVDCKQWYTCTMCQHSSDEGCNGVRDKAYYVNGHSGALSWAETPKQSYTFLEACVQGCAMYAQKKRAKGGGGPACKAGAGPRKMARTLIRERFEKQCHETHGTLDGQRCLCDNHQDEHFQECQGKGNVRSRLGRPAPGCFHDGNLGVSGFMSGCHECKCT